MAGVGVPDRCDILPTLSKKKVIPAGATGMVCGCTLRVCLDNPDVSQVTFIGRSPAEIEHPKRRDAVQDGFMETAAIYYVRHDQDAARYCPGVYTGAVGLCKAALTAGQHEPNSVDPGCNRGHDAMK